MLAGGEQHRDPLRVEPPGYEQKRLGGGGVEPVGVIDQRQDGSLLRQFGEQREARGVDQEALLRAGSAVAKAQRGAQSVRLRRRERVNQPKRRPNQLVERGER